jgi:hypothetical protein
MKNILTTLKELAPWVSVLFYGGLNINFIVLILYLTFVSILDYDIKRKLIKNKESNTIKKANQNEGNDKI